MKIAGRTGRMLAKGPCLRLPKGSWFRAALLAFPLCAFANPHEVSFSTLIPEAERVYLLGSFNKWKLSDDALMSNENGVWVKTLELPEGAHVYSFKAEGETVYGDGWQRDWKAPRDGRRRQGRLNSLLVIPDDLDIYHARQTRATSTEAGIEIPLFYDRHPDSANSFRPGGHSFQMLHSVPPRIGVILPEFSCDLPLFGDITLGNSTFLAAIDRHPADSPHYNRLWIDRNGNNDLTDDEPVAGKPRTFGRENYFDCSFPPIDLIIDVGGHRQPYCLSLRVSGEMPDPNERAGYNQGRNPLHIGISPHCSYVGEFLHEGTVYRFALADSSGNGVFGDRALLADGPRYWDRRLQAQGDSLFLTSAARVEYADGLILGRYLALGPSLFEVHLDIPGGRLTLEPLAGPAGRLVLPNPMRSMAMISSSGKDGLMLFDAAGTVPLPPGTWRLLNYQLTRQDEWGDTWAISARGVQDTPAVPVSEGEETRFGAGEPIEASVDIPQRNLDQAVASGSLRMSFRILGNQNELISDISHVSGTNTQHKRARRNSNRPEEATYRIIKPDGELITSGSFEYG